MPADLPERGAVPHKHGDMAPTSKPKHPNRVPFEGVLARVDTPSDMAPNGSNGHRLLLLRAAAEEALPSLIGMPVGFRPNFEGHDFKNRCGVITEADIVGEEIIVRGHIFGLHFPEVAAEISKPGADLGMSYEIVDAKVHDMREAIYRITEFTFTGAAIMLRNSAAYQTSRFCIEAGAAADAFTGRIVMFDSGAVRMLSEGERMPKSPSLVHRGSARVREWARKLKGQRPPLP